MSDISLAQPVAPATTRPRTAPLTYSLKTGEDTTIRHSDQYFVNIAAFADEWSARLHPWLDEPVRGMQVYQKSCGQAQRSFDELTFELLVLGVLLKEHSTQVEAMPDWAVSLLRGLIAIQARFPWMEEAIKRLRGWINSFFYRESSNHGVDVMVSIDRVDRLIRWLAVQGGDPQAERLQEWSIYLHTLNETSQNSLILASQELSNQFADESALRLGGYSQNVEAYRAAIHPGLRWRYDACLVGASALEYHLGMLGTEILNRAYRPAFQAARPGLVIVPPCLRAQKPGQCKAVETPMGARCSGCTPGCRVFQVTRLAAKKGVNVVMIPDDQLGKLCLASGQAGTGLGVVGVACAMRNWSAGWQARHLGLNAQGVLLDYAGCEKHWDRKGIPTEVNLHQLAKYLS